MPSEQSSDVRFETGHVLFIDIVGYSKLLINEQSEQLDTLKAIVRGAEQFTCTRWSQSCVSWLQRSCAFSFCRSSLCPLFSILYI
jgi:hypothetical protein